MEETTGKDIPWQPVYDDMVFVPENEVKREEESSNDDEESDIPEESEQSESSRESEVSGQSQVSERSTVSEQSASSGADSQPERISSETPAHVSGAENTFPRTGDGAALPVMMCSVLALSVMAAAHKKKPE